MGDGTKDMKHQFTGGAGCVEFFLVVSQDVVYIVLRLGVEPVYRAAIFAGSMVVSSQMAATVSSVM
jgi:hypothetical protein